MITSKEEAIEAVKDDNIDFESFSDELLKNKEVITAYMQAHSSNKLLLLGFPLDITIDEIVDDISLIIDVIKNLDVGYSRDNLELIIKQNVFSIVNKKIEKEKIEDAQLLKTIITKLMTSYKKEIDKRDKELQSKRDLISQLLDCVDEFSIVDVGSQETVNEDTKSEINEYDKTRYKRNNIGFCAKI